jgi:hypothetical protein
MKLGRRFGIAAVLALAGVALLSVPAMAQKQFLELAKMRFQLSAAQGRCTLCHGNKKGPNKDNLNDFGKAIQADPAMKPLLDKKVGYEYSDEELALLAKVIDQLGDQDSDGDGATNREELALGTFPGDANSKPSEEDLAEYRKKHPPAPPKDAVPKK